MSLPPTLYFSDLLDLYNRTPSSLKNQLDHLKFAFRVTDDNSRVKWEKGRGFVANYFSNLNFITSKDLNRHWYSQVTSDAIVLHIRNFQRGSASPFVSVSGSWLWAVIEAHKRIKGGHKNVRIAVINLEKLVRNHPFRRVTFYGVELLKTKCNGHPAANDTYTKQWPNDSQEILVYGQIPAEYVLSIVPHAMLPELPCWFRRLNSHPNSALPAWSYRHEWFSYSINYRELLSNYKMISPDTFTVVEEAVTLAQHLLSTREKLRRLEVAAIQLFGPQHRSRLPNVDNSYSNISKSMVRKSVIPLDLVALTTTWGFDRSVAESLVKIWYAGAGILSQTSSLALEISLWGLDWSAAKPGSRKNLEKAVNKEVEIIGLEFYVFMRKIKRERERIEGPC